MTPPTMGISPELHEKLKHDLLLNRQSVAAARCQTHPFISRLLNITSLDYEAAESLILDWVNGTPALALANGKDSVPAIPKISHTIWLSDLDRPSLPPAQLLNAKLHNLASCLPPDWHHIFWIRDAACQRELVQKLESSAIAFDIRDLDTVKLHQSYPIVDKLLRDRKFAFAADVLRMIALDTCGGLYCDLGLRFKVPIAPLLEQASYIFMFWRNFFFQNSCMAMPKGGAITDNYFRTLNNPRLLARETLGELTGTTEGHLISGPFITFLSFLELINTKDVAILAPNGEVVSWSSLQSWYTPGVESTCYVPDSGPSFLTEEKWCI